MKRIVKSVTASFVIIVIFALSIITVLAVAYDPVQNVSYSYSEKGDCTVDYGDSIWVNEYYHDLINAVIMGHNFTLVEILPRNNVEIQKDLWKMGLRTTPDKIFLSDDEDSDVQVKIYSDNDIGRHLCHMFDENDTLTQLNALCYLIQNSAEYLDGDIENNILHNQYLSRKELIADIREAVSAYIHWNDLL